MWIQMGCLALALLSSVPQPDKDSKTEDKAAPPAKPEATKVAEKATAEPGPTLWIRAKRVIVRPGVELENANVLVRDGKIVGVGAGIEQPKDAQAFEADTVWGSSAWPPRSACGSRDGGRTSRTSR